MQPPESKWVSAIFSTSAWGEILAKSQPPPPEGDSQRRPVERKSRLRADSSRMRSDSEGVPQKSLTQRLVTQRRVTHPFALALRRIVLGAGDDKAGNAAAARSRALATALGEVRAVTSLSEARMRAREVVLALDSSRVSTPDLALALAGITHRYLFDTRNGVAPVVPALCQGVAEGLLNPALTDARLGKLCEAFLELRQTPQGGRVAGWIGASLLECMNANEQALSPAQLVMLIQAAAGLEADADRLGQTSDDAGKSWQGRFASALDAMAAREAADDGGDRAFIDAVIDPGAAVPGAAPHQTLRFLPEGAPTLRWGGFELRGADSNALRAGSLLAASLAGKPARTGAPGTLPLGLRLLQPLVQAGPAVRPARLFALVAGVLWSRERSQGFLRHALEALLQAMAPGPVEAHTPPAMLAPMLLGHVMGKLGVTSVLESIPPAWRLAVLAHDRSHGIEGGSSASCKAPAQGLSDAMASLCKVSAGLFPHEIRAAVMGLALAHGGLDGDDPNELVVQFLGALDFASGVTDDARAQVRKQVIRGLGLAMSPGSDVLQDPDFNDVERLHLLAQAWVMPAWRDARGVAAAVQAITEARLPGWFERPLLMMATFNGIHDLDADTFRGVHASLLRTDAESSEEDIGWAHTSGRDLRELETLMDLAMGGRRVSDTKSPAVNDVLDWYHLLETRSGLGYLTEGDKRPLPAARLKADRPVMLHVQALVEVARQQVRQAWPRGGGGESLLVPQRLDRLHAGLQRGLAPVAGGGASPDSR